jgi:deoxycytidylate deaminase
MKLEYIRKIIIEDMNLITANAKVRTKCKRKGVGCQLISIREGDIICSLNYVFNGPSVEDFECSNVTGNCGCMHSEPKAIIVALKKNPLIEWIMLCTYSPCTNCANIIIHSGIVKGIVYDILTEHDKRGDKFLRQSIDVLTLQEIINRKSEANAIIERWIKTDPKH